MVNFLVDTCLISDANRGRPGPIAWLKATPPSHVFVSVITFGEIRRGVIQLGRKDTQAAARLAGWLDSLRRSFASRVLPISQEVALQWGELTAQRTRPLADALIAATAVVHRLAVVTRNIADFDDTGVVVVNPWVEE